MLKFQLHDVSVTRVVEQRGPGFAPDFLYPDWDPALLEEHRELMVPECFDVVSRRFIASIHSWVVRTRHHTILIDTCAGNHKERPSLPRFHQLDLPFLNRLSEAGVTPESVDYVMCTHLHADHCGWNTQLIDGRWEPTFPNARYVFSRKEYDYWLTHQITENMPVPLGDFRQGSCNQCCVYTGQYFFWGITERDLGIKQSFGRVRNERIIGLHCSALLQ